MSDIVEVLTPPNSFSDTATVIVSAGEMRDAAAEITALRAEVKRLNKSRNKWGQKYNKLLEKHKVTRDELATQIQWVKDLADKLIEEEAKTSTLRAKNERLRAALETTTDDCKNAFHENERLRAALEEWREAARFNITMEGAQYIGVEHSRALKAWEKTRAALEESEK